MLPLTVFGTAARAMEAALAGLGSGRHPHDLLMPFKEIQDWVRFPASDAESERYR